jgi:hypothetical protein
MNDKVNYLNPVASLAAEDRSAFIWKCYAHVVGAILAFAAVEVYLFESGIAERIALPMLNNWWMVLGAFILAGWGASHVAHRVQSMHPVEEGAASGGNRSTTCERASTKETLGMVAT